MVRFAQLLDFLVGASWLGASVPFYPVLKKYSERIALWFVGIRMIEFATLIIGGILIFSILYISQNYGEAEGDEASYMQYLGKVIRNARGSTQNLSLLAIRSELYFSII